MKISNDELNFINYLKKYNKLNVIDVGGNVGEYSKLIMDNLDVQKLTIIEPIKKCYDFLIERFSKFSNIIVLQELIDNDVKNVIFNEVCGKEAHSSILSRDWLYKKPEYHGKVIKRNITTQTIDNIFTDEEIDLLKIDTEGHELNVMMGASKLLKNNQIKFLQFEYGGTFKENNIKMNDVISYLSKFDYKVFKFENNKFIKLNSYKDDFKFCNFYASKINLENDN